MCALRVEGIRTSQERVRRLMREHDLQVPPRAGHAHGPKAHDGTITTAAPDVMWGTDMTTTVTVGEGAACVFVAVDHCTTECIGLHAAKSGNRFEALEPIRQGVRERFGAIGEGVACGLRLRHDHGSNDLAEDSARVVVADQLARSTLLADNLRVKSKVHPKYKTKYHGGNWPEYEQVLVRRGDVTLWLSAEAMDAWRPAPSGRPGGPRKFSDVSILTALMLRLVFRWPLR